MQRRTAVLAVLFSCSLGAISASAQSTGQIIVIDEEARALLEMRTPIDPPGEGEWLPAAASIVINTPGSYVLTGNILGVAGKHGIEIKKSNVTIDLNGYALIGVTDSKNGIFASTGVVNVKIHNGAIRGWGERGIAGKQMTASEVSDVRVGNCVLNGIHLGQGIVSGCTSRLNGKDGINIEHGKSVVESCAMEKNGGDGVEVGPYTRVRDVTSTGNDEHGIWADIGASISGCVASGNGLGGVVCENESSVDECVAGENQGEGIRCGDFSSVVDCGAFLNALEGIRVGQSGAVEGCVANLNDCGIKISHKGRVSRCATNSNSIGIDAGNASLVESSTANNSAVGGIKVSQGTTVRGCSTRSTGIGDGSYGIQASSGSLVIGNTCTRCTTGVWAFSGTDGIRVEDNHVTWCTTGLIIDGSFNSVLRNSAIKCDTGIEVKDASNTVFHNMVTDCTTRYDITGAQLMGTIRDSAASAEAWDNFEF